MRERGVVLGIESGAPVLLRGDCLERMAEIESGSVDLIACDPPYGTVKGVASGNVSHGMSGKTDWDETIDHEKMLSECNRVLRTNGALVLFSQDPYTAKLMTETHARVPFGYRLTWLKNHFANALIAKKAPVYYTEDVCVFFKKHVKHDFEGFHPVRPYAKEVCGFIGRDKGKLFLEMGHQGMCHFMRHETTQFSLCTEKTYNELIALYDINKMRGFRSFADISEINKTYRAELIEKMTAASPKVFNLPDGAKYKSNVLEYKKDYTGHHPTQKPVALMADLIETYSNPGDQVLDFTMGSGTTGVAAMNLGRRFIGIERDENYFNIAVGRIIDAYGQINP